MLTDFLFVVSFALQVLVFIRSSKRLENSQSGIPVLFIASVIARWLAGVMTYIALLGSGTPDTPDGVILDIASRSLNGNSLLTMIFAFLSLAVLNMMITSRGISRATEVTARFYLDSVPGRQMSVDADLASGAINYETANQRRTNINLKSSQYSMLDGISKFMVGESITSSLVLVLSIIFYIPRIHGNSEGSAEINLIIYLTARVNACALDAMTATPDVMALREVGLAQLNNSGRWNGAVVNALIRHASKLPRELYKSLTWDRGSEMADHNRFTVATDIKVYFCDLQHPWHRGSNENTNGLLRQYFPKGTDLSVYSQARFNVVARQLNERPRKTLNFDTPADRFHQTVASTG